MVVPVVERASGSGTAPVGVGAAPAPREAICTWMTFPQWQR
jgi:hypothetical protein